MRKRCTFIALFVCLASPLNSIDFWPWAQPEVDPIPEIPPEKPQLETDILLDPPLLDLVDPPLASPLPPATFCQDFQEVFAAAGDPLPIANWLNATQMGSFYRTTFQTLLSQDKYFNAIHSLGQSNFVVEPFGFSSSFKLSGENFRLQTLGATVAGSLQFHDTWSVGGGIGYWHSNLDWRNQKARVNSLYFGPQVTFLGKSGFLQLLAAGIYNMYDIHSNFFIDETSSDSHTGWNVLGRLNGGINIETPFFRMTSFYIQPNVDLSYLGVLQEKYEMTGPNDLEISVKNGYQDFFRSRLALQLWKEFYGKDLGFLIPSLSVGWIYMLPISNGKTTLNCQEEQQFTDKKYPKSNLLYVGAQLTAIHYKGYLLSLEADANLGGVYPVYRGAVRFEIDW